MSKPAVEITLGAFFGAGDPDFPKSADTWKKSLKSEFVGFDDSSHSLYCYWPMPFWSKARAVIRNRSGAPITLEVHVKYKPAAALSYSQKRTGYFHARQTLDVSAPDAFYSTAFTEQGWGKVVGLSFDCDGYAMDGDEFTYFDDSRSPQIHGSGTEDDHNQGWGGSNYQKPLWGGMVNGVQGSYRYYLNESYLFNKNIQITYEHSNAGGGRLGQRTASVIYYYKTREGLSNLHLTDALDVGNGADEKAHNYGVTAQTWTGTVGCSYEVYEQNRGHSFLQDDGRAYTGASSFTVKIDPRNEGVLLRRRCNRHMANRQVADVYVDGQKVSESSWSVCELSAPAETGWTDSDYFLPARLTAGKSQVQVKVQSVDSSNVPQGINEFHYWAYSYGPGAVPEPPGKPENLVAKAISESEIGLTWSPSSEEVVQYVIERRPGMYVLPPAGGTGFQVAGTVPAGSHSYIDRNLGNLTAYTYRVSALGNSGASPTSFEASATTLLRETTQNLALDAKAAASSEESGEPASAVNDGQAATCWCSKADLKADTWLSLDFGKPTTFNTAVVSQANLDILTMGDYEYKIQAWDGAVWKDIWKGKVTASTQQCTFAPVTADKVRLLAQNLRYAKIALKEFGIYHRP